jgi:hypothetical protein
VTLVFLLLAGLALLTFRVQHQLQSTRAQVASEGLLAFEAGPLRPIQNAGFEALASPEKYQAGIVFQGKLYLAGAGGLAEYHSLNAPPRLFRIGIDLPAAPIVRVATGILKGNSGPRLLLATTGEGVLWYDGNSFGQLLPRDPAARDITALLPLASGDLLIGTRQHGLLLFNGKTLTAFHPSLAALNVTALAGDEGDFWVGTRSRGVFHWHAGQLENFDGGTGDGSTGDGVSSDKTASLPDPQVEAISLAPGRAYVGTPEGVEEFDTENGTARPARILASGFFAHALYVDGATLTVASIDEGVREVALAPRRTSRPEEGESLQAEDFFSADFDHASLFAVTKDGVFRRMPSGDWSRVLDVESAPLADRNIAAMEFAPDGHLWIGYFDRGLDIFNPADRNTTRAEHIEDDHVFCVNRIIADPGRNTMDIATANGLALFDTTGRERQVLLRKDGLIADQVTDVLLTRDGTAVATPAGITFIDASGMQSIYAFQGLVNNHVYALSSGPGIDGGNGLLAGTLGGVSLLQAKSVQRNLTTANSALKHNWITAIVPVDRGWFVGTYGAGIMQLDANGNFSAMDGISRPTEINPNAMLVTAQHVLAGSLGQGLFVYDRSNGGMTSGISGRWSRVSAGLPSLNVTAIAEHDGYIYVGTDNGAVRIAEDRMPL